MTRNKTDIKLSLELLESSIHSLMTANDPCQRERNHAAIKASQQLLRCRVDEVLDEVTISMEAVMTDDGNIDDGMIRDIDDKSMGEAENRIIDDRRNLNEPRDFEEEYVDEFIWPRRNFEERRRTIGGHGMVQRFEVQEVEVQEVEPTKKEEEYEAKNLFVKKGKKGMHNH